MDQTTLEQEGQQDAQRLLQIKFPSQQQYCCSHLDPVVNALLSLHFLQKTYPVMMLMELTKMNPWTKARTARQTKGGKYN